MKVRYLDKNNHQTMSSINPQQSRKIVEKEFILDKAERLFIEKGFDVVSLIDISNDTGVHVEELNLRFGSKKKIIHEIYVRHMSQIVIMQIDLLDIVERYTLTSNLTIDDIVDSLVRPLIKYDKFTGLNINYFATFISKFTNQISDNSLVNNGYWFNELFNRYMFSMMTVLPHHTVSDIRYGLQFTITAACSAMTNSSYYDYKNCIENITCQTEPLIGEIFNLKYISKDDLIDKIVKFSSNGIKSMQN